VTSLLLLTQMNMVRSVAKRPYLFEVIEGLRLQPFNADTAGRIERFRPGVVVKCTAMTQPRTLPFQGYYWATLTAIVDATECAASADHLHDFLVKACNYTTLICDKSGKPIDVVRDSTAFDAMGEDEFSQYVQAAQKILAERLGVAWDEYTKSDGAASQAASGQAGAATGRKSAPATNSSERADQ
jgi:hypothetical protein